MLGGMGGSTGVHDLLGWTGRDEDDVAFGKLRGVRRLVLITLALEGWAALRYVPYSSSPGFYGAIAVALGVCALLGWHDRFAAGAVGVALALELVTVVSAFPENGNHQYLAIVWLALIALARFAVERSPRRESAGDARVALQVIRWIVVGGLAWSGVMKLFYGHWLGGEFLSFRIATDPGFAWIFAPLVPDAELARLVALDNRIGAGPFRAQAPLLVAASNLTWVAEIVLPAGLLWARTRGLALLGSLLLMAAIQAGAREFFFAGLMVGGLLLFDRRDRSPVFVPIAGGGYLVWLVWPDVASWLGAAS
jgi:hypothetical protein